MIEIIKSLNSLSEEFVEVTCRHDPVDATQMGIHDYDHHLPDDSPDGFQDRVGWLRGLDQRLTAIVPAEELPTPQRVDVALLRSRIAASLCDLEHARVQARDPVRYPRKALTGVFLLMARPFAPLEERKEAILSRLMALPGYLAGAQSCLERAPGTTIDLASEVSLNGLAFVDQVTRALVQTFRGEAERIEHAGERARMGLLQYQGFLERELRGRAREDRSVGEDVLNLRLGREHLLDLDVAALEQLAREEIGRTRSCLEDEARRLDRSRPWRDQVSEARRRHPEPLRVLDAYRLEADHARRFVEERGLAPVPESRLEVAATPAFDLPLAPYGDYVRPAPFDADLTGLLLVVPIDLSRTRDEQERQLEDHDALRLELRVLRRAYPGSHLQHLHTNGAGSRLRRIAADGAFTAGWSLYCEELMAEQGFFSNPRARLVRLEEALMRACRAAVEVGLQSGRVSLEEAVGALADWAAIERGEAEAEVRRAAAGGIASACSLAGRMAIIEIREEACRRMGSRFNLRDFHVALLAGGAVAPSLAREELWGRIG